MGVGFEYGLIGFISLFVFLSFTVLGLLGMSQIPSDVTAQPNIIEGVSYFFQNPYTSGWSKIIWSAIIITPLLSIIGMIGLNYVRGRA